MDERAWRISIQPRTTAGVRTMSGDYLVQAQGGGVWFHSDQGDHRFLALDFSDLPTLAEIQSLTMDKFIKWLGKSEPR